MKMESTRRGRPSNGKRDDVSGLAVVAFVGGMMLATMVVAWWRPIDLSCIAVQSTRLRLDLNQADAHALSVLPGIGPRLSQRIVRWRQAVGEFSHLGELQDVPGIGPGILARIRPFVHSRLKAEDRTRKVGD